MSMCNRVRVVSIVFEASTFHIKIKISKMYYFSTYLKLFVSIFSSPFIVVFIFSTACYSFGILAVINTVHKSLLRFFFQCIVVMRTWDHKYVTIVSSSDKKTQINYLETISQFTAHIHTPTNPPPPLKKSRFSFFGPKSCAMF